MEIIKFLIVIVLAGGGIVYLYHVAFFVLPGWRKINAVRGQLPMSSIGTIAKTFIAIMLIFAPSMILFS